jgi:Protein of unknown function (DUF998)
LSRWGRTRVRVPPLPAPAAGPAKQDRQEQVDDLVGHQLRAPPDFPPGHFSAVGATHIFSATVATACFPVAALLLSKRFGRDARWRRFRYPAWGLALGSGAAAAALLVTGPVAVGYFGLAQRVVAAFVLAWQLLTATGLYRVGVERPPAGPP